MPWLLRPKTGEGAAVCSYAQRIQEPFPFTPLSVRRKGRDLSPCHLITRSLKGCALPVILVYIFLINYNICIRSRRRFSENVKMCCLRQRAVLAYNRGEKLKGDYA